MLYGVKGHTGGTVCSVPRHATTVVGQPWVPPLAGGRAGRPTPQRAGGPAESEERGADPGADAEPPAQTAHPLVGASPGGASGGEHGHRAAGLGPGQAQSSPAGALRPRTQRHSIDKYQTQQPQAFSGSAGGPPPPTIPVVSHKCRHSCGTGKIILQPLDEPLGAQDVRRHFVERVRPRFDPCRGTAGSGPVGSDRRAGAVPDSRSVEGKRSWGWTSAVPGSQSYG